MFIVKSYSADLQMFEILDTDDSSVDLTDRQTLEGYLSQGFKIYGVSLDSLDLNRVLCVKYRTNLHNGASRFYDGRLMVTCDTTEDSDEIYSNVFRYDILLDKDCNLTLSEVSPILKSLSEREYSKVNFTSKKEIGYTYNSFKDDSTVYLTDLSDNSIIEATSNELFWIFIEENASISGVDIIDWDTIIIDGVNIVSNFNADSCIKEQIITTSSDKITDFMFDILSYNSFFDSIGKNCMLDYGITPYNFFNNVSKFTLREAYSIKLNAIDVYKDSAFFLDCLLNTSQEDVIDIDGKIGNYCLSINDKIFPLTDYELIQIQVLASQIKHLETLGIKASSCITTTVARSKILYGEVTSTLKEKLFNLLKVGCVAVDTNLTVISSYKHYEDNLNTRYLCSASKNWGIQVTTKDVAIVSAYGEYIHGMFLTNLTHIGAMFLDFEIDKISKYTRGQCDKVHFIEFSKDLERYLNVLDLNSKYNHLRESVIPFSVHSISILDDGDYQINILTLVSSYAGKGYGYHFTVMPALLLNIRCEEDGDMLILDLYSQTVRVNKYAFLNQSASPIDIPICYYYKYSEHVLKHFKAH